MQTAGCWQALVLIHLQELTLCNGSEMDPRLKLVAASACLLMALGIGLGAFGAHALKGMVTPERIAVWKTAVEYHTLTSLGILLVTLVFAYCSISNFWSWVALISLFGGVLIFSGTLYLLVLLDKGWLGAITPIGGLALIAGWLFAATTLFKH